MRGLNRPLLTKLIHQEVDMEIRQESRSMNVEVHFDSDKVIQACSYFICHYIDIQYEFLRLGETCICYWIMFYFLIISAMGSSQSWMRMPQ